MTWNSATRQEFLKQGKSSCTFIKVKHSHYRSMRPRGLWEVKASRFRDIGTWKWLVVSLTHRHSLLPGVTLRGWVDPGHMELSDSTEKNPQWHHRDFFGTIVDRFDRFDLLVVRVTNMGQIIFTSPSEGRHAVNFPSRKNPDGFGRERTRDLGYQRPACKPLDHRSR
jgi:hypothetical protein